MIRIFQVKKSLVMLLLVAGFFLMPQLGYALPGALYRPVIDTLPPQGRQHAPVAESKPVKPVSEVIKKVPRARNQVKPVAVPPIKLPVKPKIIPPKVIPRIRI